MTMPMSGSARLFFKATRVPGDNVAGSADEDAAAVPGDDALVWNFDSLFLQLLWNGCWVIQECIWLPPLIRDDA